MKYDNLCHNFNIIISILFLIVLCTSLIIWYYFKQNNQNNLKYETFLTKNNDPNNDGKMTFPFLNDPNYSKNVLNSYYLNDDTKVNGNRVIIHPRQMPYYGYDSPDTTDPSFTYWFNIYKRTGFQY
jgi:hypothetical protein